MKKQKSFADTHAVGKLYVVGTPIGNLQEISPRALKILKTVDLIAAEDTRHTRKLLSHFQFSTPLTSFHEHNQDTKQIEIVQQLLSGKTVALVSDAGMPAISDPGEVLVTAAIAANIPVIPVSGPNAAINALVASGLSAQPFTFIGFLPRQKRERKQALAKWATLPTTLLFYEAPHRIKAMLQDCLEVMGDRNVVIARELTKKHEEWLRGTLREVLAYFDETPALGEYCVVIEAASDTLPAQENTWWEALTIVAHVDHYIAGGMDKKAAIRQTAVDRNVARREVYQVYHQREEGS
jgi:16S rRNA (cytidine1402-2'-O)-methyltransferase